MAIREPIVGNGQADEFRVVRNDQTTEVVINGQLVYRGDRISIDELQVNGSADNDRLVVDHQNGDPLPTGGLSFTGGLGNNQMQFVNGAAEQIVYQTIDGASGQVQFTTNVANNQGVVASQTSTIRYTGINQATQDNLLAKQRTLNLTGANDVVRLMDAGTTSDGRSGIYGTGTFVNIEFVNPLQRLTINAAGGNDQINLQAVDLAYRAETILNGQSGDDAIVIDDNGSATGGSVDFVKFPLQVNGGGDANDSLVVNDTSDSTGDRFTITERTIGGEINSAGSATNLTSGGVNAPVVNGVIGTGEWSEVPNALNTGILPGQVESAVLHWVFAEGAGVTTQDQTVNNNDGGFSQPAGPQFAAGPITGPTLPGRGDTLGAVVFDGVDDTIVARDNASLDFNKSSGTISFWVLPKAQPVRNTNQIESSTLIEDTNQQIEVGISWRDDAGAALSHADTYGRIYFSPQQNFANESTNVIVSNTRLTPDVWTHVTITWDYQATGGPNAKIYINGQDDGYVLNNLPTHWTAPATDTGNWVFGGDASPQPLTRNFEGGMADVAIFSGSLSASQVQNLFQNSFSGARAQFSWDANQLYGFVQAYPGSGTVAQPGDRLQVDLLSSSGAPLLSFDTANPLPAGVTVAPVAGSTGTYEFSVALSALPGFDPAVDSLQYRIRVADQDVPGATFDSGTSQLGYTEAPTPGATVGFNRLEFTQQETLFGLHGQLTYSGIADLSVVTGSGNDTVTIYDEPTSNLDPLANPQRSFSLQTGAGNDTVTIASIDAGYAAATTIRGQGGTDSIVQLADLTLGRTGVTTGSLLFEAEAIGLDANLSTMGGTATYDGQVEVMRDIKIDTDRNDNATQGGSITFTVGSTVNSQANESNSLTIDAGTANLQFLAEVGNQQELNQVLIEEANNVLFDRTINLQGSLLQRVGTGNTTLSGTSGDGIGGLVSINADNITLKSADVVTVGNVSLTAQNQISLGAAAGINAGAATVTLLVNQDLLGNQSFTQNSSAVIRTTNETAQAIAVTVGGTGNANLSILQTGTTTDSAQITVQVGGAIVDQRANEDANLVTSRAVLNAASGIGSPTNDLDTNIKFLNAFTAREYIHIDELNNLRLDGIAAPGTFTGTPVLAGGPPQISIRSQTGVITILDQTSLQSSTGQVSNAPPLLRLDEVNPKDVIIPGDPTQEVTGTLGGDPLLGDNLELGVNFKITVRWDDGVVSVLDFPTDLNVTTTVAGNPALPILQAGDTIVWLIDANNQSTASIVHGPKAEGPINITIQRTYSLLYLQTVPNPEVLATFVAANDPNIVLNDTSGRSLNQSEPLVIATALAEDQFRQVQVLLVGERSIQFEEPNVVSFVEQSAAIPTQAMTYIEQTEIADQSEAEVAILFLVRVMPDGSEGERVMLPLSNLQDIAGLLERLKKASIANGLYRIYYGEPGLPPQQLLEFRKTGDAIGDPVREPGRGSEPLPVDAGNPQAMMPVDVRPQLPQRTANSQTAASHTLMDDSMILNPLGRAARQFRKWQG